MNVVDVPVVPAPSRREAPRRCARPGCDKPAGGWDRPSLCCACALEAFLFERSLRQEPAPPCDLSDGTDPGPR